MDFVDAMASLGVGLGVGLLVGMQREYARQPDLEALFGGTRTFGFIGIAGAMAALASQLSGETLLLVAIGLTLAAFLGIGYVSSSQHGDLGLTSEMAAMVTFIAGVFAGYAELAIATALGVVTAALLAVKPFTRELSSRIDQEDVLASVKFGLIAALLLPLLPDETYGPSPWNAVSPYKVGLMIVFISGLSFVAYVAIQAVGARRGIGLTGLLGGLVSSTAVTLTLSERSRSAGKLSRLLGLGVLLAWVIMFGRVLIEVGVVNTDLLPEVWLPITVGGLIAAAWAGYLYVRGAEHRDEDGIEEQKLANPFKLGPAIQFGLLYGFIIIGSTALSDSLGEAGVYLGAIASGVADVDAITLSMSELSRGDGVISDETAANAIVLAAASNTLVKAGIVWAAGSGAIRTAVLPGAIGAIVVSVGLAFLF